MDRFLTKKRMKYTSNPKTLYFSELSEIFEKISKTTKRLEIQEILTNYYKNVIKIDKKILSSICYLCMARVYPEYLGFELGTGEQILIEVVRSMLNLEKNIEKFNKIRKNKDLGLILQENKMKEVIKKDSNQNETKDSDENEIKNSNGNEIKDSDGNEIKDSDGNEIKDSNENKIKNSNGNEIKDSSENEVKNSNEKLTVDFVYKKLQNICKISGKDSKNQKFNSIISLLIKMNPTESKYLIRILEGSLKIGLALQTILISLGVALECPNLKEAYNRLPDFDQLIPLAILYKNDILKYCLVTPLIPLSPMLAQGVKNIFNKMENNFKENSSKSFLNKIKNNFFDFENTIFEYKYDGERIQIHKKGNEVGLFSRNKENLKEKYPEIIELAKEICKSDDDYILDCEIVAYDGKILPFQVLSTRKRKQENFGSLNIFFKTKNSNEKEKQNGNFNMKNSDENEFSNKKINVCIFAFDILFFNKNLLETELKERKEILHKNFKEIENKFKFVNQKILKNDQQIMNFFEESLEKNCEGLMIKDLKSFYMPSHRSNYWLKFKKDYMNSADTFDLVLMGAYYGKGKRYGKYGKFLLGSYHNGMVESVCRLGTGFDDEMLDLISKRLVGVEKSKIYVSNDNPDIWVEPVEIWEVKAADITISPQYMCCNELGKSLSLRFPRFIRVRDDKNLENCTTSQEILRMYEEQ